MTVQKPFVQQGFGSEDPEVVNQRLLEVAKNEPSYGGDDISRIFAWDYLLDTWFQDKRVGKRTKLSVMTLRRYVENYNEELEEYYDEDFGSGFLCSDSNYGSNMVLCLVDENEKANISKEVRQKIKKAGKYRRDKLKHQWTYRNPMNRIHGYIMLTDVTSDMTPKGKRVMSIPLICSSYFSTFRGVGCDLMDLTKEFCSAVGYTDIVLEVSNEWAWMAEPPENLREEGDWEEEEEEWEEEEEDEELDENLVECDGCGRVWDGNAQCPCGLDEDEEEEIWYPENEVLEIISSELWKKCLRKENGTPYHNFGEDYVQCYVQAYLFEEYHSTEGKKKKPLPEENDPKDYEYGGFWYKKGFKSQERLIGFYEKFGFKEDQDIYLKWGCFSDHPYPSMSVSL